jgi:hypothetical protein
MSPVQCFSLHLYEVQPVSPARSILGEHEQVRLDQVLVDRAQAVQHLRIYFGVESRDHLGRGQGGIPMGTIWSSSPYMMSIGRVVPPQLFGEIDPGEGIGAVENAFPDLSTSSGAGTRLQALREPWHRRLALQNSGRKSLMNCDRSARTLVTNFTKGPDR